MSKGEIARERIEILFEQAENRFEENPDLADRYVELAQRIGERTQISIPGELGKKFCSNCSSFLKPGRNCSVNINSREKVVEYRCGECGEANRYGYKED